MKKKLFLKSLPLALGICLLASGQGVLAHSTLEISEIPEGGGTYTKYYNNIVVGHGCGVNPIIASSFVFPDDTGEVWANGALTGTILSDISTSGSPTITRVPSRDVFAFGQVNLGDPTLTNPVGSQSWYDSSISAGTTPQNGNGLAAKYTAGLIPFAAGKVNINPTSCAKSITFEVAIIDICSVTSLEAAVGGTTVNGWLPTTTPEAWITALHKVNDYAPATYKVTRLKTNKMPKKDLSGNACKGGIDYKVKPTTTQLTRDLPITSPTGAVPSFVYPTAVQ